MIERLGLQVKPRVARMQEQVMAIDTETHTISLSSK
jgi:hypothetical protein